MNGNSASPAADLILPNPQREAVELLTRLLNDAHAGRIATLGVVTVTTLGQMAMHVTGPQLVLLHFGAANLQKACMDAIAAGNRPLGR